MTVIEFKKQYKAYYSPGARNPEIVTVPKMQFAMVDGQGDPNDSKEFQDAIGALYGVIFGLKFARKKAGKEPDYTSGPLEGLWWTPGAKQFEMGKKSDWLWTAMIWLPDFISQAEFKEQVEIMKTKKPNSALAKIRLDTFEEGLAVQIMHIGPYANEQPNIEKMHAFAAEQGYQQNGKHHEIYLGDPRRAKPEKLRTILRHPLKSI